MANNNIYFNIAVNKCNMSNKLNVISGSKFGKLTVIEEAERYILPSGQTNRAFLCKCDCGKEKKIRLAHLVRKRINSCGCLPRNRNGKSNNPLYKVWRSMRERCAKNAIDSHRYYQRGISVCDEWMECYHCFMDWAEGKYKKGLQLDRINNSLGYSPENCRFVTCLENQNNKDETIYVNYDGERRPLCLILHEKGIRNKYYTIRSRIKRGWEAQTAIDKPMRVGNYKRKIN